MTFLELLEKRDDVQITVDTLSESLQKFPKGEMGLTPDTVKNSPEFKEVKSNFNKQFSSLRKLNSFIMKNFKKEYAEYRKYNRKV